MTVERRDPDLPAAAGPLYHDPLELDRRFDHGGVAGACPVGRVAELLQEDLADLAVQQIVEEARRKLHPGEEDLALCVSLHESGRQLGEDRKSTRLNSSHANISYAVFCLKKKKKKNKLHHILKKNKKKQTTS